MESWRHVWRTAAAQRFSDNGLIALRKALIEDDVRLCQGATCSPPPLQCVQDWPMEAGDLFAFAHWIGDKGGTCTVAEGEEYFARMCFDIDQILEEPAGCRHLLNAYDEMPRDEMRRLLLSEVTLELAKREEVSWRVEEVIGTFMPNTPAGIIADALDDAGLSASAHLMRG